ncbi:MAG: anti-sigma factor [Melioribacteraceae bacterium]|nr:anti-sigma factor [Melioribacteraceae bacterium]MCF8353328.1 anti-sigma factor [Melioribacteraceae bacterium]MCF8393192.1 anti-sigma factor [Melioribacteraceae bacterium]MCF8419054.1 anti-sigma factor [Melioribacteraceae bacterium]
MADKVISEMITAYALGCMDKENFDQFHRHLKKGGKIPLGELGELQNLSVLIPSLLELEAPNPMLKEKLTENLLALRDEIERKKQAAERKTKAEKPQPKLKLEEDKIQSPPEIAEETGKTIEKIPKGISFSSTDKYKETTKEKLTQQSSAEQVKTYIDQPDDKKVTDVPPTRETPKPQFINLQPGDKDWFNNFIKSKTTWILAGIPLFLFLLLLIIFGSQIGSLSDSIDKLNNNVSGLQSEVERNKEFVSRHLALVEFFNNTNIDVVELSGTDLYPGTNGQLLITFTEREGLLKLNNMPIPKGNEAYQLWMVSDGQSYSLGVFVPNLSEKYIRIDNVPFIPRENVEMFRITNEPRSGSEMPTGQTYLFGSLYQPQEESKRR